MPKLVLLEENLPQNLRPLLTEHTVITVAFREWAGKSNGAPIVGSQGISHPIMFTKLQKRQEQFEKRGIRLIHIASKSCNLEFASFI